ncbi:YjgB protein [Priestia megaterium]|uniref:YjgB family protein n=1 Tax=Priestia megaterium TaxID=1404 RepID=UPI000E15E109|nr:YjgB family protein [Priestia megaterium]SSY69867.1 YjgB protein [Priestia megaterium]
MKTKRMLTRMMATATIIGIGAVGATYVSHEDTIIAHADTKQTEMDQTAVKNINEIYNAGIKGEVPRLTKGIKIGLSTRDDVHSFLGLPPEGATGSFDYYHAEMGHAGYAFGYDGNRVISEIRYFGTNVERQTNLGSITELNLKKQLGQPNFTKRIKNGKLIQTKYTYHSGAYDLEFIFDNTTSLNHVNLISKS